MPRFNHQSTLGIKAPRAAHYPKTGKQHSRLTIVPNSSREIREYFAKHGAQSRRGCRCRMGSAAFDEARRADKVLARLAADQRTKTVADATEAGDRWTSAASPLICSDDSDSSSSSAIGICLCTAARMVSRRNARR